MMGICGIDEVGRGCLAGPVAAAAVVVDDRFPKPIIDSMADSKMLSAKQRESIAMNVFSYAPAWAIAWASVAEIDRHNILQASLLAMKRAFQLIMTATLSCDIICGYGINDMDSSITPPIDQIIVDGIYLPEVNPPCPIHSMVKADATIPAVQAAAIIAKVSRDQLLKMYDRQYPYYGFGKHKGYPTKQHRAAIKRYGILPIHRRSFKLTIEH